VILRTRPLSSLAISGVLAAVALTGVTIRGLAREGGITGEPSAVSSSSESVEYCLDSYSTNPSQPSIRLRIPRKYLSRASSQSNCKHIKGLNILVSFPSMEPATGEMINCVGDCNGRLWISIGNETGDPWKTAQRWYHFNLMNDEVLAKRNLSSALVLKRIQDTRFTEVYETEPTGVQGEKATWYVDKKESGEIGAVIRCSRETPQVSCRANFSSLRHPGMKIALLFHGQRLDQWREIRASVEGFLDSLVFRSN
jgi:hypothetical protein